MTTGGRHITPEALAKAMCGYPLATSQSLEWLAALVSRSFEYVGGDGLEIDRHPGRLAIRNELARIADDLAAAVRALRDRTEWAESALRRQSMRRSFDIKSFESRLDHYDPENYVPDGLDNLDAGKDEWWLERSRSLAGPGTDWERFRQEVGGLVALEQRVRLSTEITGAGSDAPRWRDAAKRSRRETFAICLSFVFEKAYGAEATVNNWDDGQGKPIGGNWPDFFNRIATMAYRVDRVPDLLGLLKAARKKRIDHQRQVDEEGAGEFLPEQFFNLNPP